MLKIRFWKKSLSILVLAFCISLCGCNFSDNESAPMEKVEATNEINGLSVKGEITYLVKSIEPVTDLKEKSLNSSEFNKQVHNYYNSDETKQEIDEIIGEGGMVRDEYVLVLLDLSIKNKNAVGIRKANEFEISSFKLATKNYAFGEVEVSEDGSETITREPFNLYRICYFDHHGSLEDEDEYCIFELTQGENLECVVGYLVLKEDVEKNNLMGVVGETSFDIDLGEKDD